MVFAAQNLSDGSVTYDLPITHYYLHRSPFNFGQLLNRFPNVYGQPYLLCYVNQTSLILPSESVGDAFDLWTGPNFADYHTAQY
jgi:hypothetical protein